MESRSPVTKQNTINPIVGYKEKSSSLACPCCNRYIPDDRNNAIYHDYRCELAHHGQERKEELLSKRESLDTDSIHCIKKILKSGWIHKKGTGNDWIGSRSWKSRWACLVLASVEGFETEIPLLQIYWHQSSTFPSSNILLDSCVVVPMNRLDEDENNMTVNKFCFDIVKNIYDVSSEKVFRSFAVDDEKERNVWSSTLVEEITKYEKRVKTNRIQKARSRVGLVAHDKGMKKRSTAKDSLPPVSPPTSPLRERVVMSMPAFSKLPRPDEEHRASAFPQRLQNIPNLRI